MTFLSFVRNIPKSIRCELSIVDFADRLFDPMKYETQAEKRREQMEVFDIADMEEVSI